MLDAPEFVEPSTSTTTWSLLNMMVEANEAGADPESEFDPDPRPMVP